MTLPSEQLLAPRPSRSRTAEPPEKAAPRSLREFVDTVRDAARFAADFCLELARSPVVRPLDSQQLSQVGQTLFELDAIRRGELKDYVQLHRLRQADRSNDLRAATLELNREKFHFNAAEVVLKHFAEIKQIHDNGALPHPAKLAALRQILFGVMPASDPVDPVLDDLPEEPASFN